MEYKVVEARGDLGYYLPFSDVCVDHDNVDTVQCYWVVKFDLDRLEIVERVEMFPTLDLAEDYIKEMERSKSLHEWGEQQRAE